MLRIEGVRVSYGPVPVLLGIDLAVAAGEVVAVVGANGSGRSTLLGAVSGLVPVRAGRIELAGTPLVGLRPAQVVRLGVAHVLSGRRVFARMSVRENLELGGRARPGGDGLARVHALFPVLAERAGQVAGTLSGGEQQMLAFGRALMAQPRLLLLDEPLIGLAPIVAAQLLDAVREVRAQGVAVLLAEQAEPALRAADRGYVLAGGRVVLSGAAADLLVDDGVRRAHLGG